MKVPRLRLLQAAVDFGEEQSRTTIRASPLLMVHMVAAELGSVGT